MDWIGNISKWTLWAVETLAWEPNRFVARGGCGVERGGCGVPRCHFEHMLLMLLMLLVAAQVCAWLRIWMRCGAWHLELQAACKKIVRAIGMRRGHERGRHGGGAVVPSS